MKKYSLIKLASLIILLMTFMVTWSQNELVITMNIDFENWNRNNPKSWYDHITFTDDDNDDATPKNLHNGEKGQSFRSLVKKNQKLKWVSQYENEPEGFKEIVLISVIRNPKPGLGGNELFDSSWYNSIDGGVSIKGKVKDQNIEYESERYIISFAVRYNDDSEYDIYTVDPIISGHQ